MNVCRREAQETGKRPRRGEKPISGAYPAAGSDLRRDNIENDIPAADLEDL